MAKTSGCPFCFSRAAETIETVIHGPHALTRFQCGDCGASWNEVLDGEGGATQRHRSERVADSAVHRER